MSRLLLPMLAALVEALAAIGAAIGILRLARGSSLDAPWIERSLSAQLLVGLPLYGTLLWLAGLFSTSAIAVCAITLPLALFALASLAARRSDRVSLRTRDVFGALTLAAAGIFSLLFAQLPSFSLDELAYHLAVPMQWIIAGKVVIRSKRMRQIVWPGACCSHARAWPTPRDDECQSSRRRVTSGLANPW